MFNPFDRPMRTLISSAALCLVAGLAHASPQPPAVNDELGIGWRANAVIGISSDPIQAVKGRGFARLAKGSDAVEIDYARLIKLNGDSDVYVMWLASTFSYAQLVAGFTRAISDGKVPVIRPEDVSPETRQAINDVLDRRGNSGAVPVDVRAQAALILEHVRRSRARDGRQGGALNWSRVCSDEVFVRYRTQGDTTVDSYPCDAIERNSREKLRSAGLDGMAALGRSLVSRGLDEMYFGKGRTFSRQVIVPFIRAKQRIGVAYLIVANAGYEAAWGTHDVPTTLDLNGVARDSKVIGQTASAAAKDVQYAQQNWLAASMDRLIDATNTWGQSAYSTGYDYVSPNEGLALIEATQSRGTFECSLKAARKAAQAGSASSDVVGC